MTDLVQITDFVRKTDFVQKTDFARICFLYGVRFCARSVFVRGPFSYEIRSTQSNDGPTKPSVDERKESLVDTGDQGAIKDAFLS